VKDVNIPFSEESNDDDVVMEEIAGKAIRRPLKKQNTVKVKRSNTIEEPVLT